MTTMGACPQRHTGKPYKPSIKTSVFQIRIADRDDLAKIFHISPLTLLHSERPNLYINPFALRKAKIVYNFGLSECKRVKNLCCDHINTILLSCFYCGVTT